MMKVKYFLFALIISMVCSSIAGCKEISVPVDELELTDLTVENMTDHSDETDLQRNRIQIDNPEIAEHLYYDSSKEEKFLYIAGLKVFEEFSTSNEGFVLLYPNNNILNFRITKATGTITGAVDGPFISFDLDLGTNTIISKERIPAPDYESYDRPEFAAHSNEIIEITDERMIEIGNYFYELMVDFEDIVQSEE